MSDPSLSPPRRPRRWWRRFALAAIVAVGILGAWHLFGDIAPPDLSDLVVERRVVGDGDNGFLLVQFTDDDFDDDVEWVALDIRSEDWSAENARAVILSHAEVLRRYEESLTRADFQWPAPESPKPDGATNHFRYFQRILLLVHARALLALEGGDPGLALSQCLDFARFGARAERGQGGIGAYVLGRKTRSHTLRLLGSIVSQHGIRLDLSDLRSSLSRIEVLRPDLQAWRDALVMDCHQTFALIDSHSSRELTSLIGFNIETLTPLCRNLTKKVIADDVRVLLENSKRPWSERARIPPDPPATVTLFGVTFLLPSKNATGRLVRDALAQTLQKGEAVLRLGNTLEFEGARLCLALEIHRKEHGALPDTLAALVPDILDAVPLDPYDGEPLRFSADKRIIWSVGEDLTDDQGDAGQRGDANESVWEWDGNGKDTVLRLGF